MPQSKINRKYNLKKDKHDERDQYHNFFVHRTQPAIKLVDLRSHCPPVYDQGELGSCTANAIAGAYEFDEMKEKEKNTFTPSRLFIYYGERAMEGTISEDAGAEIRDGIKFINQVGVCPESMWPYDITKFAIKPPQNCYNVCSNHKCTSYKKVVQNLQQLKQCLINGYPFVFGIMVYESFESDAVAKTGKVPMPQPNEQLLGGHAVMCVGFDDNKQVFIVRNSWGPNWGDKGYFYLPYKYVTSPNLSSDFWTVLTVTDK